MCRNTIRGCFVWFSLLVLGIHFDSSGIAAVEPRPSSTSEECDPGERRVADLLQSCTGSAEERRQLAAFGDSIPSERWRDMAECVRKRQVRARGHFALHISKCAGSSLCKMYASNNCSGNEKSNCNIGELDTFAKWVRRDTVDRLGWAPGMAVLDGSARERDVACGHMASEMGRLGMNVIMYERWLPRGTVCKDFVNAVVVREPLQRLVSHYIHLHRWCLRGANNQTCSWFFEEQDGKSGHSFNVSFTSKEFDIVTDNFYTRSLNSADVYQSPFGFDGRGEQLASRAMEALRRFDWILLIGSEDSQEQNHNKLIQTAGMGMVEAMGHTNKGTVRDQREREVTPQSSLTPQSRQQLRDINKWDFAIWSLAQQLYELDLYALSRQVRYRPIKFLSTFPD